MRRDLKCDAEAGGLTHLLGQTVGLAHQPVGEDDLLPQAGQALLEGVVLLAAPSLQPRHHAGGRNEAGRSERVVLQVGCQGGGGGDVALELLELSFVLLPLVFYIIIIFSVSSFKK